MAFYSNWRVTRTSILFVVGIIVLAGLVFGGIWLVKERGEQARRDEAVKIAEQNLEDQSKVAIDRATDVVNNSNNGNTVGTDNPADNVPAGDTTQTTSSSTDELPTTGPEFTNVIIITIMSLAVAFYATSRKAVRES